MAGHHFGGAADLELGDADGDVGGLASAFDAHGVFYPDHLCFGQELTCSAVCNYIYVALIGNAD